MVNKPDDGFAFYKISFQWYSAIGAVTTWIVAVIGSYLTGGQDMSKFNIQLLSPFVHKLLPEKYRHTELKSIDNKMSADKANHQNGVKAELTGLIPHNNEKVSP